MGTAHETSFGGLLKRLRLSAGLTQERLAERASLSAKTVSSLERHPDRVPFLETVTSLADALFLQPGERARLMQAARPETSLPAPDLRAVEEKVHSAPDLPARYPEIAGALSDPPVDRRESLGPILKLGTKQEGRRMRTQMLLRLSTYAELTNRYE